MRRCVGHTATGRSTMFPLTPPRHETYCDRQARVSAEAPREFERLRCSAVVARSGGVEWRHVW